MSADTTGAEIVDWRSVAEDLTERVRCALQGAYVSCLGMLDTCSFSTKSKSAESMSCERTCWYAHATIGPTRPSFAVTGALAQKQSLSEERKRRVELRHVPAPPLRRCRTHQRSSDRACRRALVEEGELVGKLLAIISNLGVRRANNTSAACWPTSVCLGRPTPAQHAGPHLIRDQPTAALGRCTPAPGLSAHRRRD